MSSERLNPLSPSTQAPGSFQATLLGPAQAQKHPPNSGKLTHPQIPQSEDRHLRARGTVCKSKPTRPMTRLYKGHDTCHR